MESDLVIRRLLIEHCQRDADGHVMPIGMFGRVEGKSGFEDRDRAIGHFEGGIVLTFAILRIVLPQVDGENARDLENELISGEGLGLEREVDVEVIAARGDSGGSDR